MPFGFDVKDFMYGAVILRACESNYGLSFGIRPSGQNENLYFATKNQKDFLLLLKHGTSVAKKRGVNGKYHYFDFNINQGEDRGIKQLLAQTGLQLSDVLVGFVCADKYSLGNGIANYQKRGASYKRDNYFFVYTDYPQLLTLGQLTPQGDRRLRVLRVSRSVAHIYAGGNPMANNLVVPVADFTGPIF